MSEVMRAEFEKAFPDDRFVWNAERGEYWGARGANLGDGVLGACLRRDRELEIWKMATLRAYGDGHRAGFESGMKSAHPFEPAFAMQDDSPRMMAIGQNGNNGEHYE